MMENLIGKIKISFPFVVFGLCGELRGVYLEVSVSVKSRIERHVPTKEQCASDAFL